MVSIRRPSNPGSGGTKDTKFIRRVDVQDPQIHKLWCLGLDNITRKVHPTVLVEVVAGTVGEFMTNYLAENVHIISIIGKLYINSSIQFLAFLILSGGVDCHLFPSCKLSVKPQAWDTVLFPIITGELARVYLIVIQVSPGVLPSLPVRITCLGVWLTCALLHAASVMTSFVEVVSSI